MPVQTRSQKKAETSMSLVKKPRPKKRFMIGFPLTQMKLRNHLRVKNMKRLLLVEKKLEH